VDGGDYVVKVANPADPAAVLHLQNAAMRCLAEAWTAGTAPRPLETREGGTLGELEHDGAILYLRVVTYLQGTPLSRVPERDPASLRRLGAAIGEADRLLASLDVPDVARELPWDLSRAGWIGSRTAAIADRRRRGIVERWLLQYRARTLPLLDELPRSLVHGDANDENLLVAPHADGGWGVSGLLDFGDLAFGHTVNDLAITCAYAIFGAGDPVAAAASVIAGYHEARRLSGLEIRAVLPLIGLRLSVSVTMSAIAATEDPANDHRQISQADAWRALEALERLDWRRAENRFREACGVGPRRPGLPGPRPMNLAALQERRRRQIGPSLRLSYREPLTILRGSGTYLFRADGGALLDCVNNICHVGHAHPRVVAALGEQASVLNTNTRYLHPYLVEYAERLAATFPEPLRICYFVNSGSEANELAVRLARAFTGRSDVIVLEGAYHGNTTTLVDLSPYKCEGPGGGGLAPWAHKVAKPDPYRGPHRGASDEVGRAYAAEVRRTCEALHDRGTPPALFLCESILGCGGQVSLPPSYLRETFGHVRRAGAVCAVDEVQVGLGRVGSHWWAFEGHGAVPDIVTLGKPLGNGHPLGAVVTTREIAEAFDNGMEYFNSFGGNPVSMAVGLAVMDVVEEEGLRERAASVGARLAEGLQGLARRYPQIGDVRGAGMFLGVELVRDRGTLEPATRETAALVEAALGDGILLAAEGPHGNVLKVKPPLVFGEEEAELLLGALDRHLGTVFKGATCGPTGS
jgi:4-aminobutyrate aminotransferase-like enzyme/Ser/Thr protein kinase RdoA (MazF antagonist)